MMNLQCWPFVLAVVQLLQAVEVVVVAAALSLDAFAISAALGTLRASRGRRAVFRVAFHFGFFQFLMPLVGWILGSRLGTLVAQWDHWIAAALLLIIAARMAYHREAAQAVMLEPGDPTRGLRLIGLSLACSIDAFAVGLSFSFVQRAIWAPAVVFGLFAAVGSLIGLWLGRAVAGLLGKSVERVAASVLVLVALKIVVEHCS